MILFKPTVKVVVYAGDTATNITELDTDFEIVASTDSEPNTAHITIYQLGPSLRGLFKARFQGVEFWAGYAGETKMIFRGTISNVSDKPAPNSATEIWAGDGQKELSDTYLSESFVKGTLVSVILKKVATASGIPFIIEEPLFNESIMSGVSHSGRLKNVLDEITKDFGFTWSIQYGTLEILNEGQYLSRDPTAVLLRPDTGLLEPPTLFQYEEKLKARQTKGKEPKLTNAIKATSLLNPEITPGRLIEIQSAKTAFSFSDPFKKAKGMPTSADGIYFCQRLRYSGNNYGGPFQVEIEADLK